MAAWKIGACGAFAFLLGITASLGSESVPLHPAEKHERKSNLIMSSTHLQKVLSAYTREAPIAVVVYKTRFTLRDITYADGRFEKSVPCPETMYFFQDGIKDQIRLDGSFSVVKELQHSAPTLGAVRKTVTVQQRWGGDVNYHRFWPLVEPSRRGEAVMALAVFESEATHVLDAELIAPLGKDDIPVFEEFFKYLKIRLPEEVAVHEAEALLDSPNILCVWLGLTRLEKLNMLGARHFYRAASASNPMQVPQLLSEMLWNDRCKATRNELMDHLVLLLKVPDKQLHVARLLNNRFIPRCQSENKLADVEALQRVTKEYRDQNLAALETRPVDLAELNKFISWTP